MAPPWASCSPAPHSGPVGADTPLQGYPVCVHLLASECGHHWDLQDRIILHVDPWWSKTYQDTDNPQIYVNEMRILAFGRSSCCVQFEWLEVWLIMRMWCVMFVADHTLSAPWHIGDEARLILFQSWKFVLTLHKTTTLPYSFVVHLVNWKFTFNMSSQIHPNPWSIIVHGVWNIYNKKSKTEGNKPVVKTFEIRIYLASLPTAITLKYPLDLCTSSKVFSIYTNICTLVYRHKIVPGEVSKADTTVDLL